MPTTINEFIQLIPNLTLEEQVEIRNQLDASIDETLTLSQQAAEQTDIALMEQRFNDIEAGRLQVHPWEEYRTKLTAKHGL